MTKMFRLLWRLVVRIVVILVVIVATIMLVRAFDARRMPDLEAWHTTKFTEEFTAADVGETTSYADYLAAEERVFQELDDKVISAAREQAVTYLRYNPDNSSWPNTFGKNWNRSYEERPEKPWGGAVLVHGLTDSPYSMRSIGELMRDQGLYVVAPRMPGHGVAPSGLLEANWEDWLAVVTLAVRQVREELGPDAPIIVGGYSNGGALVTKYTLEALEDPELPMPDQVFLFSPAIGITGFARLASWHLFLSAIPYFEKFRWESILPEYDPYKYNSFPKIAGHQTFALSMAINDQLQRMQEAGTLADMPPVLAFQSLADATVLTDALATRLFDRLSTPNSELVLYDVNRSNAVLEFMLPRYDRLLERIKAASRRGYTLTVLSNIDSNSREVGPSSYLPGGGETVGSPTGLIWPERVYSMSHVAIPFRVEDPVYGVPDDPTIFSLGDLSPRGERGALRVSVVQFMRLRHNPFFPYMAERITDFLAPLNPETPTP